MSGVEGYMESTMSGLVAGISLANKLNNKPTLVFPPETMVGAIINYLTTKNDNFQPMNANFGILPAIEEKIKDKTERKLQKSKRALKFYDKEQI